MNSSINYRRNCGTTGDDTMTLKEKEDREKAWVFLNNVLRETQDLPLDIDCWIRDELCDQSHNKNENEEDPNMGSDEGQCQVCKVSWDAGRFTVRLLCSLRKKEVKRLCKKPKEKQSSREKRQLEAYFSKKSIFELICHTCRKKDFYYFKRLPKNKKKVKELKGIIAKSNEITSVNEEERNKEVQNEKTLETLGKNEKENQTLEDRIATSITRTLSGNIDSTRKVCKQKLANKGAQSAQQKKLKDKWKQQVKKKQPEKKQQLEKKLQLVQENKKKNKIKVSELKKVLLKEPEKKSALEGFLSSLF